MAFLHLIFAIRLLLFVTRYLWLALCDLIYVTCYLDLLIWNLLFLAKTYSYIVICLVNFNQTCHIFITHRPHSYCFVTQFHTSTHITPILFSHYCQPLQNFPLSLWRPLTSAKSALCYNLRAVKFGGDYFGGREAKNQLMQIVFWKSQKR